MQMIDLEPVTRQRSARIDEFVATHPELASPFLVVDLDVVRDHYQRLRRALPQAAIHYAVKANPDPAVLRLLVELGSNFDVASIGEIERCLALGAAPSQLSYGNTIKKSADIAAAHRLGIRVFTVDAPAELSKLIEHAPGATALVRLASDGDGADWPLSRKFGASPAEAERLLLTAAASGLDVGIAFHVGSQQHDPTAWDRPLATVARLADTLHHHGVRLRTVDIGGGLPSSHFVPTLPVESYGNAIEAAVYHHLGDLDLDLIVEPGRYLVGDAGSIRAQVVLIADKEADGGRRWVYLDIGVFNGLVETQEEAIRYRIACPGTAGPLAPAVIAGPTCDSLDILYERQAYPLPVDLQVGGAVDILSAGAYTSSYSSVEFNGFEPLRSYYLAPTKENQS